MTPDSAQQQFLDCQWRAEALSVLLKAAIAAAALLPDDERERWAAVCEMASLQHELDTCRAELERAALALNEGEHAVRN